MRFTTSAYLLAGIAYVNAASNVRQATTITDSSGKTIVNSGIADDTMTSMTMAMTEAASTSESRPPGAESSLAIIIDGSTMYEPGVNSGDATMDSPDSATASADSTGTDNSSGRGSRITQAPVVVDGVPVAALLAI